MSQDDSPSDTSEASVINMSRRCAGETARRRVGDSRDVGRVSRELLGMHASVLRRFVDSGEPGICSDAALVDVLARYGAMNMYTEGSTLTATLNLEPTDVKKQFFDSEESFVKVARIRSQDPYRVVEDVKFKQEEKEAVIPQEDASIGQQNVCLSSRR